MLRKLDDLTGKHDDARADIDLLKNAFPSADLEGHKRYHQFIIDDAERNRRLETSKLEERRRLRQVIQEKTISGLIWSGVVWFASFVWTHLPKLWESR